MSGSEDFTAHRQTSAPVGGLPPSQVEMCHVTSLP